MCRSGHVDMCQVVNVFLFQFVCKCVRVHFNCFLYEHFSQLLAHLHLNVRAFCSLFMFLLFVSLNGARLIVWSVLVCKTVYTSCNVETCWCWHGSTFKSLRDETFETYTAAYFGCYSFWKIHFQWCIPILNFFCLLNLLLGSIKLIKSVFEKHGGGGNVRVMFRLNWIASDWMLTHRTMN